MPGLVLYVPRTHAVQVSVVVVIVPVYPALQKHAVTLELPEVDWVLSGQSWQALLLAYVSAPQMSQAWLPVSPLMYPGAHGWQLPLSRKYPMSQTQSWISLLPASETVCCGQGAHVRRSCVYVSVGQVAHALVLDRVLVHAALPIAPSGQFTHRLEPDVDLYLPSSQAAQPVDARPVKPGSHLQESIPLRG